MMSRGYAPGADQNIDGEVNSLDVAQFSLDFVNKVGAADANGDALFTANDVDVFLEQYSANQ